MGGLDLFEQPGPKRVFQHPARGTLRLTTTHDRRRRPSAPSCRAAENVGVSPIPRKTLNRQDAKVAKIWRLCLRNRKTRRPLVGRQRCASGASLRPIPPDVLGALAVQEFRIEVRCLQRTARPSAPALSHRRSTGNARGGGLPSVARSDRRVVAGVVVEYTGCRGPVWSEKIQSGISRSYALPVGSPERSRRAQ